MWKPAVRYTFVRRNVRVFARFAVEHYLVVPLGVVIALLWANSAGESYFWMSNHASFAVNAIGMAFVLAVLMQEALEGMLPGGTLDPRKCAVLPVIAAAGGVVGAVFTYDLYVATIADEPVAALGWPIACAADVAMSFVIARSIFRSQAASTFVLLLAIATDVIGLLIVSDRYLSRDRDPLAATLIVAAVALAVVLRRVPVRSFWPYLLFPGMLSWWGCYWAGLHPALALLPLVPFLQHSRRRFDPVAHDAAGRHRATNHFEYVFNRPVQVVLFLFGIVNGGVLWRGFGGGTWAVLVAMLIGRPLGIIGAVGLSVAGGLQLPSQLKWREVVVLAVTASSGFTFAMFFAAAVFPIGPTRIQAEMGAMATIAGAALAIATARLLRVGRFADTAQRTQRSADSGPPVGAPT